MEKELLGSISCIEADITDISSLMDALEGVQTTQVVVVMEGLTNIPGGRQWNGCSPPLSALTAEQSIVPETPFQGFI